MIQKTMVKNAISVILIQAFLLSIMPIDMNRCAYAVQNEDNPTLLTRQQEAAANPDAVIIPREFGLVKSKFTGNAGKLIIHIQDAHCNYEAQNNIVSMLENLIKNYGLSFIAVEGADGIIDTSWFKAFPDEDVRKEVANYFMKKGEITGPEYLSITTNYPIKLFGAETRSYYIQNLNAFTSSFPQKEATEQYYARIKAALNRLKKYIYSEDLKRLDAKSEDYEAKKIRFNDYVRFLQEMAEKHKVNLREYDNFFRLVSVLVYEKKIDFNFTDKERNALIDELSKSVSKDELTELVNQSMSFKMAKTSSADYYNFLKDLAAKKGVDMAKRFPNLYNYIIYNSTYARIENEKLFHDIKEIENAIKEKLFTSDDQRTLEKLSRHVDMMLGLVNIKLLNGDYEYYKLHKDEFTYSAFSDFIKKNIERYGLLCDIEPPGEAVAKSVPKLEEFYEVAIKRDRALVDNTLSAMASDKEPIAVLITGGFHSEGMAKLLEKQGISYMIVCPSITKDVPTPYLKILTNQRTSFDDILVDTVATARERVLQAILESRLVSLDDAEIAAFFAEAPVEQEELGVLVSGVVERTHNLRIGWETARVNRRLAAALSVAGTNPYGRDIATMKEAYRAAVRARAIEDALETRSIITGTNNVTLTEEERARIETSVDTITSTPQFDGIFNAVYDRLRPQLAVGGLKAAGPAFGESAAEGVRPVAVRSEAEIPQPGETFEHTPEEVRASSDAGERSRSLAEAMSAREGTFDVPRHIIFIESAIPAEQASLTRNLRNQCERYYNKKGYTVHVVRNHSEAIELIRQNADWDKSNTIMGLANRGDLDAIELALKAQDMTDRAKLLAMTMTEGADPANQYIPIKGFFDLMGTMVRINRPLNKDNENDRTVLYGVRDLLRSMGVADSDKLVDALTAEDFFIDPIKAARNFIIRLLPRARAFTAKELRSRVDAALAAVRSL